MEYKKSGKYDPDKPFDFNKKCNYCEKVSEWEREASITIFQNGKISLEQNVGIRIKGQSTRDKPQKSFRVHARKKYGKKKMKSSTLFPNNKDINGNPITEYDSLCIRAVSDDDRDRDLFVNKILYNRILQGSVEMQESFLFINGEFWGMYVITEKYSEDYFSSHYNLPDEDITVEYGREYPTYENNYPKANTEEATVTFKYHDGETDDYVSYVEKSYTPNGWLINDTHYGEDTIVFTEETTLVPDYAETVIPVEFPSDPTWFRHDFDGLFTEETGGEQVTSYSDLVDTELHAHWHDHMAIITTPDGDVQVDENKQFTFPTNNIPKDSTKPGIVTFDPQNGEVPIKNDIIKIYTPNGWLLDGVHYDDGETITVLDDSTIIPDYIETISVEYPSNPVKTYYTFKGWYDALNGGDKVENYNEAESITLYAHYYQTNPDGEEYILPSEHPEKPTETLATVTFKYHNGDPDTTATVTKKWIAKGWLVDGELHYNGDIIYKTPDTVIEPNYTYVIVPAQFPIAPTRGNERYTGWFTEETGGEQVKRYSETEDIILHAQYTD
ncbi:MAG: InlB B-repeat-containing protein, partial [Bacilli bacterium]|nr:InlB B-repeat-containing protein [Bacilli bacterium]